LGGGGARQASAQVAAPHSASPAGDWWGKMRVSLDDRPLADGELGRLASFPAENLPQLDGVILRIQRLAPGAAREPHWHAYKTEINYVIEGSGEIGIIGRDNTLTRVAISPGSVTQIPEGLVHYIVNSGETELRLVIAFNGITSLTFNHSNAFQAFSRDRFAQSGQTPLDATPAFLEREAALYTAPEPLEPPADGAPAVVDGQLISVNVADIAGIDLPDGSVRTVMGTSLPGLKDLSLGILRLEPGAMRDIHWHPTGDELAFVVSGDVEWGRLSPGSDGRSDVFLSKAGDAVNNPEGWLHYAANVGNSPAELVVVWASADSRATDLSTMLGVLPPQMSVASSGGDADQAYFDALYGQPRRYIVPALD